MKAMKTRTWILIASHTLLLGAGYGWHRAVGAKAEKAVPMAVEAPVRKVDERKPGSVSTVAGEAHWSGSECRKAWHAVKGSKIPPAELALLRQRILREWAAKDLRPALIAWSDEETLNSSEVSNAIQRAFDGHEEEMLGWIEAGDFGLDSPQLLYALTSRMEDKDPLLLLKLMPKVPEEFQQRVMQGLFGSHSHPGPDREAMDQRIEGIASLPDERLRSLAWQAVLEGMAKRGEERFHEVLGREDLPVEVRSAALGSFAEGLAGAQLPVKALADFRRLSPENRAEIGPSLLEHAKRLSFARPGAVTNALTMLAESGQWDLLEKEGPAAVDHFFKSSKPNPEALGRWALALPEREETSGVFRRAVAPRFRDDPVAGAEWARSLPEGWQRDQALAQLAMTADADHKDAAVRDQAISEITDPAILEELQEWRQTKSVAK
jgi:hypothetical protein